MAKLSDRITLNPSFKSPPGRRASIEVRSEPITFDLSPEALGRPIADAIAAAIRDAIDNIPERASAATIAMRKRAGITSDRLFDATGRLIAGIAATIAGNNTWSIAAPSDRLRSPAVFARLLELVPLLRDPSKLLEHPKVRAAYERVMRTMITKGRP
jgi:hypothetical protein